MKSAVLGLRVAQVVAGQRILQGPAKTPGISNLHNHFTIHAYNPGGLILIAQVSSVQCLLQGPAKIQGISAIHILITPRPLNDGYLILLT